MGAFYRFAITVASVLITAGIVWFVLKQYGQSRPISPYQTDLARKLLNSQTPLLFKSWATGMPTRGDLFIQTRFQNNQWVIGDTDHDLQSFLTEHEGGRILLEVNLSSTSKAGELKKIINETQAEAKVIFTSRSDGALKDLRELSPAWTFTNGEIFLARFLSLSSLGLASTMEIKADVFMIHMHNLKPSSDWISILREAKRQNKPIIIGPVTRPLEEYSVQGWWIRPSSRDI
ncbi:MAG: hypothetical protein KDD33_09270 [Bdellovibrionales bacterium]|nr:hypothetical protein [Bdellovibrionales bacterium]